MEEEINIDSLMDGVTKEEILIIKLESEVSENKNLQSQLKAKDKEIEELKAHIISRGHRSGCSYRNGSCGCGFLIL